uniref:UDP-glucose 4-epimerase n=1 Tax=Escherichia albertii TaxID=208962 RepID=A0A1Z1EDS2_ESCAL|nr:UDP-glucose 4-epimerase [Escherichia albertii]
MILVTGGLGYIGSHTVVELLSRDYEVIILDNFSNSSPEVVAKIKAISGVEPLIFEGDIRDVNLLKKIFTDNNISDIIHFAGLKSVAESIKCPLAYYNNNVIGTLTLIDCALNFKIKNFIFSSSATVYGNPETIPLDEHCNTGGTTNPYGTSKYLVERILQDIAKAHSELNITILRYFNPVGAHPSGLIGESPIGVPNNLMPFISRVASGKYEYVSVYGNDYDTPDGTGVRDFIHVMDLATGHVAALENQNREKNLHIYNLGAGVGYSVLDIIRKFEEVNGVKINYKFSERREGDIGECWSNPSLAFKELKWKATKTLDDMVKDVWKWQKNNP